MVSHVNQYASFWFMLFGKKVRGAKFDCIGVRSFSVRHSAIRIAKGKEPFTAISSATPQCAAAKISKTACPAEFASRNWWRASRPLFESRAINEIHDK